MSPETIELIIKWGPLAMVVLTFIVCFFIGFIRGTYNVIRRLIYVVLYVLFIYIFIGKITSFVLDFNIPFGNVGSVRGMIRDLVENNESINNFLSYSSGLKSLIIESPEIVVTPILFIVLILVGLPLSFPIYWIYLIFWHIFAKRVLKREKYEKDEDGSILLNEKGKKVKVERKKHRLVGGLIRAVQGVTLICLSLLPVNFINRIYNKAKAEAELENGETLCGEFGFVDIDEKICRYFELYNKTIFAKIGGEKSLDKYINNYLTTVEVDGNKVSLEKELSSIAVSLVYINDSGLIDLLLSKDFDFDTLDLSKIDYDKINFALDSLFSSYIVSRVSEAGLKYMMNEVLNDKLVDLFKDSDIVSKLEYENSIEIKEELKNAVKLVKFVVEKNMDNLVIDNKNDALAIVNGLRDDDIEKLLSKLLSLRVISNSMPSVLKAYGEKYGFGAIDSVTSELNNEISDILVGALRFIQTLEVTSVNDLKKGNMVENLTNTFFENGAIKSNTKESLVTLLNNLNSSYLFRNVVGTCINQLLETEKYKVDARVLKYVDSEDAWLKELNVLEQIYQMYDEYDKYDVVNYNNVTNLLDSISGTKVMISIFPFTYAEILPELGIEVDGDGLPEIDFGEGSEDSSKFEFYNTWESELLILKNISSSVGVLKIQSLGDISVDLINTDTNVDAIASIMSEVYKSKILKEPFVDYMKDILNEFILDFEIEFTKDELLSINTKNKWKNEFSNINRVLEIDFSDENNVNSVNLANIFDAVGDMELLKTKKIDVLKYAVRESEFLTQEEYESIEWPDVNNQDSVNSFWENETTVLVDIVDEKDTIETLSSNTDLQTMDIDEIGGLLNRTMKSKILNTIVTNKVSDLFVDNDVRDDRDVGENTYYLKESISNVSDWKVELSSLKDLLNITEENMNDEIDGKTRIENMFVSIEESELLQNTRANLLLKAVRTIDICEVPEDVTANVLRENDYEKYNHEKDVIVKVSKEKDAFDELSSMSLEEMDTTSVGNLMDTVTSSIIFKDYAVDQIIEVFIDNDVRDDRDRGENTSNLEDSISSVSEWKKEFDSIKEMLSITEENMNEEVDGKTRIENMFISIEESELLQNTRANLLLKAVRTIDICEVPNTVSVNVLRENDYAKYNHEKDVIIQVSKEKDSFDNLGTMSLETIDTEKIGSLMDTVTSSIIFKDYVVDEIVKVFVDNDVRDDRDADDSTDNLKASIASVDNWKVEFDSIKEMLSITEENMNEEVDGKTRIENMFINIEESELLQNTRANLLLKAVGTINICEIPEGVTVNVLMDNDYQKYNHEKNVIIEVSKNKEMFDDIATMELKNVDIIKIGELLDAVTSSIIFKDYVVDEILEVFVSNELYDDRDYGTTKTVYLRSSIADVDSWVNELTVIQDMLNMTKDNFNETIDGVTRIKIMFNNIESSQLLRNMRANLLIKAIDTIQLEDVSIPNDVTVVTLRRNNYEQYHKEINVFVTFSENIDSIDSLTDITDLGENKDAIASVLDAMKESKILETKYVSTLDTALSSINSNEDLQNYGVTFKTKQQTNNYKDIVWTNEINCLTTISDNINIVSKYDSSSIDTPEERIETIGIIGSTLDAVSSSALLGETEANIIADSVISALSNGIINKVNKPTGKSWSQAFTEALEILDNIPSL